MDSALKERQGLERPQKKREIPNKGTAWLRHRVGKWVKKKPWLFGHLLTCEPLFSCVSRVPSPDLPKSPWYGDKRTLMLGKEEEAPTLIG